MVFATIFKFKSKSKAKKFSVSTPVAVTVLQVPAATAQAEPISATSVDTLAAAPKSPSPSTTEEPAPTEPEVELDDPAALQEIIGNQTFHAPVNTNNTRLTNSNNDGVDNENCTITGDNTTYCSNPATFDARTPPILFANENGTLRRVRPCLITNDKNDQVRELYLDDDDLGDTGNMNLLAKFERALRAAGLSESVIRETIFALRCGFKISLQDLLGSQVQNSVPLLLAKAAITA